MHILSIKGFEMQELLKYEVWKCANTTYNTLRSQL